MTTTDGRILVVEDDVEVRDVLAMLLTESGYDVLQAIDGQHALDLLADDVVDLILLDYGLPRLNGSAFCAAYRERGGRAPVILLSAAPGDTAGAAFEACGAVAYVPKPFDVDELLAAIERSTGVDAAAAS